MNKSRCWKILYAGILSYAPFNSLQAQTFKTLASFNRTNGANPQYSQLVQGTDGSLYGTTVVGGMGNGGTVFKITPSGTLTTFYSFSGADTTATEPYAGLIQGIDGNFYGMTISIGSLVIFEITPGGALTTLHTFGSNEGTLPYSSLIQAADGNFYGTTFGGGANNDGTIFKVTPDGTFTTLHSFDYTDDGSSPHSALIQAADGNLYGTTSVGGPNGGSGTIFKITTGGSLTTLFSFGANGSGLYGEEPYGSLIQASDGNLYGTTRLGGSGVGGTIFKVTLAGTLTSLHSFNLTDGRSPAGALIQATDGNFYGTTTSGGASNDGTIFKMTPDGTVTTLHNFSGADGRTPEAGPTQGADGKLYGTTTNGGSIDVGTIYSLALASSSLPTPSITPGGIVPVNSSSTTIQPGEWVSIYGTNLASAPKTWNGDFPESLGGASVKINGRAAYLWYVSPTQINLQAPDDTTTGSVPVSVTTGSGTATSTVTLAPFAPSFLLLDSRHVTGIILRPDGSGAYGGGTYDILGPSGKSLGYATVAAKAGDSLELFAVGLGPTSPFVPAGQAFSSAAPTTHPVDLLIGSAKLTPAFAGLSGAGLYQINLTVPAGLGTGDVSLTATVGGVQTPSGVVISLQ